MPDQILNPDANAVNRLIDAARKTHEPQVVIIEPRHPGENPVRYLLTPTATGVEARCIEADMIAHADAPRSKRGEATAESLDSLIALADHHHLDDQVEQTAIFISTAETATRVVAVLDYDGTDAATPRHGKHRIAFHVVHSRQWLAWRKAQSAGYLEPASFAELVQDRILDIATPPPALAGPRTDCPGEMLHLWDYRETLGGRFATPAQMVELGRGIEINAETRVVQRRSLDTGEAQISYDERHHGEAGDSVRIPNLFCLRIPVFERGTDFLLACRLSYRLKDGRVRFAVQMLDADSAIDAARDRLADRCAIETGAPVFFGTPER